MKPRIGRKHLAGSVTLEAALVLPLMLIFLMFCVRMLQMRQVEALWGYAAEEAIEEARMVLAVKDFEHHSESEDDASSGVFVRQTITARVLRARQTWAFEKWLESSPELHGLLTPTGAWIEEPTQGLRGYRAQARIGVGPFSYSTEYRTLMPTWVVDVPNAEEESEDDTESVWSADNFTRGHAFREKYGGNLPSSFRVLSGYVHGDARVIKSMDLTAPSLQSTARLEREVGKTMDAFVAFEPSPSERHVLGGEIKTRVALWIIPENSPLDRVHALRQVLATYERLGIRSEVIRDGISARFDSVP